MIGVGASKGIGKYLYDSYKETEEYLVGTYNSSAKQDNHYYKVDITQTDQVDIFVSEIESQLSNVTLINCAGVSYNCFAHKSDRVKWKYIAEVNLIGTYNIIRSLLPYMREQKYGRIINFSSVVAQKSVPGTSAYAASKAGLWGLAKSLVQENAHLNITINSINLGYSELGMIRDVPDAYLETIMQKIPANKLCPPNDILLTVNYMRDCSYINGASIDLNGGLV